MQRKFRRTSRWSRYGTANTAGTREIRTFNNLANSTGEAWLAKYNADLGMMFSIAANAQRFSMEMTRDNRLQLAKLFRVRRALLASYATGQPRGYLHRTVNEDGMCGIAVVNLESGKRTTTKLCPSLGEVGLYNLLDAETKTLYHHSLRMLPENDQRIEDTSKGMRRYIVQLVAEPIALD